MNVNFANSLFTSLVVLFGLVQVIVWLIIGWRAMRAHEKLAGSVDLLARHIQRRDSTPPPPRAIPPQA